MKGDKGGRRRVEAKVYDKGFHGWLECAYIPSSECGWECLLVLVPFKLFEADKQEVYGIAVNFLMETYRKHGWDLHLWSMSLAFSALHPVTPHETQLLMILPTHFGCGHVTLHRSSVTWKNLLLIVTSHPIIKIATSNFYYNLDHDRTKSLPISISVSVQPSTCQSTPSIQQTPISSKMCISTSNGRSITTNC